MSSPPFVPLGSPSSQQQLPPLMPSHLAPNLQQPNKTEQTFLWAQDSYNIDSGIHSGTLTGAPTILSGKSSLHEELLYGSNTDVWNTPFACNLEPFDETSEQQFHGTRPQQFHNFSGSMFPEIADEGIEGGPVISTGGPQNYRHAKDQQNSEPPALDPQDTALASKAIPEIVGLLRDTDQVILGNAANMVLQLSKEASINLLIESGDMMSTLVNISNSTLDDDIAKTIAGIFYNISKQHHGYGLQAILRHNGVGAIVRLCGMEKEGILFYSVIVLHNLLLGIGLPKDQIERAKNEVRQYGGVLRMVQLLRVENSKFLAIVSDCLQILALSNQESKVVIYKNNGPAELIRIMQQYSYEKLLWTTCRVIRVLSACKLNKVAIVQARGVQVLAKFLKSSSHRLVQNCLWTLRNLSDAATKEDNMEELISCLVDILNTPNLEPSMVTYCTGILSNLTCNNEKNKLTVVYARGIPALIQTLLTHPKRDDISEPAVCALRHITSRHEKAELAQNEVRQHNGLRAIGMLLTPPARWPLIKAILGLVRNLTLCAQNREPLQEIGIVPILTQILNKAFQDIQQAIQAHGPTPSYDGVSMMDIADLTVAGLHGIAKNTNNRNLICAQFSSLIPLVAEFLFGTNESVMRFSVGTLSELAESPSGAQLIEQLPRAVLRLRELCQIRKPTDDIGKFAAETLQRIGRHKSGPTIGAQLQDMQQQAAPQMSDHSSVYWDQSSGVQFMNEEMFQSEVMYQPNIFSSSSMASVGSGVAGGWDQSMESDCLSPMNIGWGPPTPNQQLSMMPVQPQHNQLQFPAQHTALQQGSPNPALNPLSSWMDTQMQ